MSGIVGFYALDGCPASRLTLTQMNERLAHRGPDGRGVWCQGPVGLGQCLLWTTPESLHERLPLVEAEADLALVADARLDNREELLAALGLRSDPAQPLPDSALILAAYRRWGEDCPAHLLGDFALALWDGRAQKLFCARDPLGVKPFYYYHAAWGFVCASELKALFVLPEVPRRLNEVRLADHLALTLQDEAATFYEGILRLPAAHALTVERQGLRLWRYWTLDNVPDVRLASDEAYAAAFREVFGEAVRCRLRSAYPVGSLLSGGLDSSSIVCVAREQLRRENRAPLHTFSAVFPDLPELDRRLLDERRYIAAVVAGGGIVPHEVLADQLSPLRDWERIFWHEDEGFFAPNLYLHWALYAAAQTQGVRVLLDGFDGDTVVSHGWERLGELARTGHWKALYDEAGAMAAHYHLSRRELIWKQGVKPFMPDWMLQLGRRLRGRTQPAWAVNRAISPAFVKRIGFAKRVRALEAPERKARTARERHWESVTSGLFPYSLELVDKLAPAFTLEPRYPFFDRRVVAFCVGIPPDQKLHQGWTRWVMRRGMEGLLPPEVQWRVRKANLSPNLHRQLLARDGALVEQVLREPGVLRPYIDLPALEAAYQRYSAEPFTASQEALTVYTVVNLGLWLTWERTVEAAPDASGRVVVSALCGV